MHRDSSQITNIKGAVATLDICRILGAMLEVNLCADLGSTTGLRIGGLSSETSRLNDRERLAKGRVVEIAIRLCKVRMVEHVVRFEPQLQIAMAVLTQREILIEFQIRVVKSRTMEEVSARVAEGS
jgi:hypothetical protein